MLSPHDLGFPDSFDQFRDCQHEAYEFALTSEKRFIAMGIPPGGGKSAIAYGLAKLFGGRTVILTATHGLEDQYRDTFIGNRIAHIRGRRNYACWEGGNCDDGRRMQCADKLGCPYLCDFRSQDAANIVVTNYAYWLAANSRGEGIRKPDTLVCDEAGLADGWLSNSLDFRFTERQSREAGLGFHASQRPGEDIEEWSGLAPRILQSAYDHLALVQLESKSSGRFTGKDFGRLRRAEEIYDAAYKLSQFSKHDNNWICTRVDGSDEGRLWRFQCVWPGRYKERLFQGIQRVILMSATLRPKTMQLLGIKRDDYEFKEWSRQFPAVNGPVIWVPTCKVKHDERWGNEDRQKWIERHDEIFKWGSDRNGLTHTVSYARAKQIGEQLGSRYRIVLNGAADPETATATQAFETFKQGDCGSVLVSPSFSTGWNFAGRTAEWQVLSKMPFLPPTDKLIAARTDQDFDYPWYMAGQELVQSSGRINRYPDDRGTTLIVDDNVKWLLRAAGDHVPKWFKVRREEQLPRPLEKL